MFVWRVDVWAIVNVWKIFYIKIGAPKNDMRFCVAARVHESAFLYMCLNPAIIYTKKHIGAAPQNADNACVDPTEIKY